MDRILEGPEGVECNIHDVLIYGPIHDEHGRRLNVVLPRQAAANVTLNTGKCIVSVTKILFLCHVISADGIEADPEKIAASTNLSQPRNIQEVRSFLGMVNQLNKFTNHLADQTKSLIELLQNDCKWICIWGPALAKAF